MLIYTHPNLYQVVNVQNLLKVSRIESQVRNEYAAGGTGDLSANDTWVELWLEDERDETKAEEIIRALKTEDVEDWFCSKCGEKNGGAFEFCWHCQNEQKQ